MNENFGPFKRIATRTVYRNHWIEVREDRVLRPGGAEGVFGIVTMKPGATVLAMTEAREVYLVSEYKYGAQRDSVELVSGAIEEGETPLEAAKRELREELGFQAQEWTDFGILDPFTTLINSPNYLFMARDLSQVGDGPDEGEVLAAIKVPFADALEMAHSSGITHGASNVLILKAASFLGIARRR